MQRSLSCFILVSLLIFGCKEDNDGFDNPLLASQLKLSKDTLLIGENTLALTTYVYRDFMPVAEEDGSAMLSACKIADVDSIPFSSPLSLKKQYVINGDLVWVTEIGEISTPSSFEQEGVSRGGPKWGPEINVDVVCEFSNQGTIYRIIARDQEIHRTD